MKSDKALWGSISILVGAVIAILAPIRGVWQTWLLIGVFTLWGLWVVAVLLRPYMQQAKRRRMHEQLAKNVWQKGFLLISRPDFRPWRPQKQNCFCSAMSITGSPPTFGQFIRMCGGNGVKRDQRN